MDANLFCLRLVTFRTGNVKINLFIKLLNYLIYIWQNFNQTHEFWSENWTILLLIVLLFSILTINICITIFGLKHNIYCKVVKNHDLWNDQKSKFWFDILLPQTTSWSDFWSNFHIIFQIKKKPNLYLIWTKNRASSGQKSYYFTKFLKVFFKSDPRISEYQVKDQIQISKGFFLFDLQITKKKIKSDH